MERGYKEPVDRVYFILFYFFIQVEWASAQRCQPTGRADKEVSGDAACCVSGQGGEDAGAFQGALRGGRRLRLQRQAPDGCLPARGAPAGPASLVARPGLVLRYREVLEARTLAVGCSGPLCNHLSIPACGNVVAPQPPDSGGHAGCSLFHEQNA